MSLSKDQSFDDNYRRDSFSDRVCDDLSEVILQFLPLNDKFKLECVSNQFERTVFRRQYVLSYDEIDSYLDLNAKQKYYFLERILKKLSNIRSLQSYNCLNELTIDLIIKYCHNLVEIDCKLSQLSERSKDKFIKRFGSKIVSVFVSNNDFEKHKDFINSLTKVKELSYQSHHWNRSHITTFGISFVKQTSHLKNMKKITIQLLKNESEVLTEDLEMFFNNNRSLTHLTVYLRAFDLNFADFLFKEISKLNYLIDLEINAIYVLSNGFKQMAVNCHKLKSLTIDYITTDVSHIEPILNELKSFKRLQRLAINGIQYHSGIELILNKYLKNLNHLTHLKLGFGHNIPAILLEETLLTDLDKYLPELRYLFVHAKIKATRKTADILSRLSRLESVVIIAYNPLINELIESKVIENCPRIKYIKN